MTSPVVKIVLVIALVCVLGVLIAPSVDLPATVYRSLLWAHSLLLWIGLIEILCFLAIPRRFVTFAPDAIDDYDRSTPGDLDALLCVFLC